MTIIEHSPYPVYKFDSLSEFLKVEPNTLGICDFCNSAMLDNLYLIPYVNRLVCEKCFKSFMKAEEKLDYNHVDELIKEKQDMEPDVEAWKQRIKEAGLM